MSRIIIMIIRVSKSFSKITMPDLCCLSQIKQYKCHKLKYMSYYWHKESFFNMTEVCKSNDKSIPFLCFLCCVVDMSHVFRSTRIFEIRKG